MNEKDASFGASFFLSPFTVIHKKKTFSTNDDALQLFLEGAPEFTVIWSDHQLKGRGRTGSWLDLSRDSLLFSVILKPQILLSQSVLLYELAILSLLEVVTSLVPHKSVFFKRPNDIMFRVMGHKMLKIAGVLVENQVYQSVIKGSVIGVGFNLNTDQSFFKTHSLLATSLSYVTKKRYDRKQILTFFLNRLAKNYRMVRCFQKNGIPKKLERYKIID